MFAFGEKKNSPERHLSGVYHNIKLWALVYHTGHGEEVELITERFFTSKEKALAWLKRKTKAKHWIQPEVIKVSYFNLLKLDAETVQQIL